MTYHVLLIGIDAYPLGPLHGCVNDIDAIQRLLLSPRLAISPTHIRRLTSPHPTAPHDTALPAAPATLANIRAALAALASDLISPTDRVLIYYAGHGARIPVITPDGRTFHRESLVPVDVAANPATPRPLFDFELNAALAAITVRSRAVTVILDCCHSAGASRKDLPGMTPRYLDFRTDLGHSNPLPIPPEHAEAASTSHHLAGAVDDCHVVAACLAHELAQEATGPAGIPHGLLTAALLAALDALPDADLRPVPWGRLWHRVRAAVEARNPWQHPWMAGNLARAWAAGPPVSGDHGLDITRAGPNAYHVDAGTLASITPGAGLAVYGHAPPLFPPLGTEEDDRARVAASLLTVTSAERATAVARADGTPFDLPPGARGRLVRAGAPERLRCAVVPENEAIAASLALSPLLTVVEPAHAEVRMEGRSEGSWAVTDDIHGAKPGSPVLVTLTPATLLRAREVLEHYVRYALPLRLATRCTDLVGALRVSVLACPGDRELSAAEAQAAALPEAGTRGEGLVELTAGDKVCVRVGNGSHETLRVTLLNCAASGKVQVLGDQVIAAGSEQVFWAQSTLGKGFTMRVQAGREAGIDRLVAIGTTALGRDMGWLRVERSFAEVVGGVRDFGEDRGALSGLVERWTAAQVVMRTRVG